MSEHFDGDNLFVLPGVAHPDAPPVAEEAEAPAPQGPPPAALLDVVVESILLAADRPVSVEELDRVLMSPGIEAITLALRNVQDRLRAGPGGVRLVQIAKGWQLRTDPRAAPWVAAFRGGRPLRLSRAALETLTVVAYRQPVTRAEVEDLRGVDAGGVMRMLVDHELIEVMGRKEDAGRPMLYGTTARFLEVFGLRDLSDLPTLRDLAGNQPHDARLGPEPTVAEVGQDDEPQAPLRSPPTMLRPVDPHRGDPL